LIWKSNNKTTMKSPLTLLILILFLSCGQNQTSKSESPTLPATDTSTDNRWHFKKYLNDPRTPQLAKDIFNNNWKLNDDEPLEFLEKIHGEDKGARPFYFRVVTNSRSQSDGAYSEGLGNAGYEYVKNYPGEFSNYFIGEEAFTEKDLKTWADIVMLEFEIIGEGEYDKPLVKDYLGEVYKNCKDCSTQQKEALDRFGKYLNEQWAEFLKHVDK
jgi:hypothetical protein